MARPIDHRSAYGFPAAKVHAVLTDEAFLRARLAEIGGRESQLVSHDVSAGGARTVMRQSIDADVLPSVVRRIAPDGVTIERIETWTTAPDGRFQGTVEATVGGMPGSLRGTTGLADAGAGSEHTVNAEVKVGIPLVGGKIESVIAEELGKLLHAESRFTARWLERRG